MYLDRFRMLKPPCPPVLDKPRIREALGCAIVAQGEDSAANQGSQILSSIHSEFEQRMRHLCSVILRDVEHSIKLTLWLIE